MHLLLIVLEKTLCCRALLTLSIAVGLATMPLILEPEVLDLPLFCYITQWLNEAVQYHEHYDKFNHKLPAALRRELTKTEERCHFAITDVPTRNPRILQFVNEQRKIMRPDHVIWYVFSFSARPEGLFMKFYRSESWVTMRVGGRVYLQRSALGVLLSSMGWSSIRKKPCQTVAGILTSTLSISRAPATPQVRRLGGGVPLHVRPPHPVRHLRQAQRGEAPQQVSSFRQEESKTCSSVALPLCHTFQSPYLSIASH